MPYKIAQIAVNPKNNVDFLSKIFLSQPSMEEEQLLGKLFVLAEIKNRKPDIALASFIIDRINLFYYQNEQIPLLARLATVTVNDIFESSLAKLNQAIVAFIQNEKINIAGDDCNLTIGVIYKNKLYFCNLGHNKALLIYKPKIKSNRQINGYDLLNITLSTADPTQDIVLADKLFTNTISGSIPADGYFVFTNEALHEFLTETQLVKIITTLQPSGAAEQIKNILEQTNIFMPFVGLIIKNHQLSKKSEETYALAPSQQNISSATPVYHSLSTNREREQNFRQERDLNKESIKTLNRTAAKTDQILRSPGFINPIKIKQLFNKLKFNDVKKKQNKLLLKRENLTWLKKEGLISLKNVGQGFIKAGQLTWTLWMSISQTIAKKEARQELKERLAITKERMDKKHLIMAVIIVLSIFGLIASIYWGNIKKAERQQNTAWENASQQFSDKEKQIETDLIYNNKNKAQLTLEEMSGFMETLKNNVGSKHLEELNNLNQRYQSLVDRISNLSRLKTPEKIWSLSENQSANNLALVDNNLYLIDQNSQNIIRFNLNNKESQTIISNESGVKLLNTDRDGNIFFLGQNKLITIDKTGAIKNKTITNLNNSATIANVYNNRLYLFNDSIKRLYRYQLTSADSISPDNWLPETFSGNINDLAIDTSIFLLTDSQILEYYNGQNKNLVLDSPFPTLTQAKKLIAPINTDILAVLEPATKRLIIFSRAGKLLGQYTSDDWNNLQDLAIDSSGKVAYLLNNKDIYKIDILKK